MNKLLESNVIKGASKNEEINQQEAETSAEETGEATAKESPRW